MYLNRFILRKRTLNASRVLILGFIFTAAVSLQAQTLGIDVYAGSGTITWTSVKSAGISFAWTKATEGINYIDANIGANESNGKAAGVYMGAYDFAHPEKNAPDTEAVYFWNVASNYIKADGKTIMPMLDYETFPGPVVGAANYPDWANQWCQDVQALAAASGVSVTPVIYISACNTSELSSLDNWTIPWIANYNGDGPSSGNPWIASCTPNEIWGSGVWAIWQYTSSASISGVTGNCDEDVFNGTVAQMTNTLLVGQIQLTTRLTNITVVAGNTAIFNVNATASVGSLTYQWRFNQKNISGATANTYTITNAQANNAGAYSVVVTNNAGDDIINTAFLTVVSPLANGINSPLDPPNLVNWWTGDGNGFDIYGTNNLTPAGNLVYTNGEVSQAFRLDGQTTGLPIPGGSEIAPNWTACMWIFHQRSRCTAAALLGDKLYAIKVEQYSNTDEVGISHSGVADYLFSPAYIVPLNTWTHLAFVATSTGVTLYANGVQKGTVSVSNFELPRNYIGADQFPGVTNVLSDFFIGGLDDIQIFNRALSAAEIASIYNAGSSGLVRAPQFTSITTNGNGQMQLNIIGQIAKPITINSSPDLFNWTQMGVISNQFGVTNFVDPDIAEPAKFYRATQAY
jgi:GH25 family lysozyme M1 (1,4-beta-N-acetylmuramidase)